MAHRLFNQFSYSFERQLVKLAGAFTQDGDAVHSELIDQGITYTAVALGPSGDDITIELVDPAANDEPLAIEVTDSAIVVTLATDSGGLITTDADALIAALELDMDVMALISVSGSGATPLTALAETPLAGGETPVFTDNLPQSFMAMEQIGDGEYELTLTDTYAALLSMSGMLQLASAADKRIELASVDTAAKSIVIRVLTGSTPANLLDGDVMYIELSLRNSR